MDYKTMMEEAVALEAELKARGEEWDFSWIGTGPSSDALHALAESLDARRLDGTHDPSNQPSVAPPDQPSSVEIESTIQNAVRVLRNEGPVPQ
jgi:hypothetical protein